jgi:cobalt-zinc-cadmium efflux system membrane fusion protein
VTIATTAATTRSLAAEIETTGQVQFDETRIAHVSPRIPGRLHEVSAQLGDRVDRGQALAVLDSVELGAAKGSYLQAKARAAVASQSFEREKRLAAREISSQKEMLEAQADDRVAHAGLLAAHQTLRLYGLSSGAIDRIGYDRSGSALVTLRAPLAGKIVEKHATSGELVTPESKIYTVADVAILWIWIDIYERDLARVHIGDQAYVRADAYPDDRFEGTVKYIEDQVDPNTRTLRARIEVANPDEKLRSGMFTRVRLADPHGADTEAVARPMVVIPRAAVQRDGDDRVVFVKTADDRYERRVVKLGRQTHDVVEVLDGVKAGDPVVTTGGFILKSEFAKGSLGGGHSH